MSLRLSESTEFSSKETNSVGVSLELMRWTTLRRVCSRILQSLNPNNHLFVSMFRTAFHNLFEFSISVASVS